MYGKACHLPFELEHKAYCATKLLNFELKDANGRRLLQLNKLDEFQLQAYESVRIYKEHTKRWYYIPLFNSRLKCFPGKIKSSWSGLFENFKW